MDFESKRKMVLRSSPRSHKNFFDFLKITSLNSWFYLVLGIIICYILKCFFIIPIGVIEIASKCVLWLVSILFLPGYTLIKALFFDKELSTTERFALSLGLSPAIIILIGYTFLLLSDYVLWDSVILIVLLIFMITNTFIGIYRRYKHQIKIEMTCENSRLKELPARTSRHLILPLLCFIGWLFSVLNVKILHLNITDTPFLKLNFFFWPFFIVGCYLFFLHIKRPFLKLVIFSIFGLMSIGTLAIIEPNGRYHDSYRNSALSYLLIHGGLTGQSSGVLYLKSFPGSLIFNAILLDLVQVKSLIRFYPILVIPFYVCGIFLLTKWFLENKRRNHLKTGPINFSKASIFSVFFIFAYGSFFFLRINVAPQTLSFILASFFLAIYFRDAKKENKKFVSLSILFYLAIVFTHIITSIMLLIVVFGFWLVKKDSSVNSRIGELVLYSSICFAHLTYVAKWSMRLAIKTVVDVFRTSREFEASSLYAPEIAGTQGYILIHRVVMTYLALFFIISLIKVFQNDREIAKKLITWGVVLLPFIAAIFYGHFQDRAYLYYCLPSSLLFGIGLSAFFEGYKKREIKGFIILITVVFACLQASISYRSDVAEMVTADEVQGINFIISHQGVHPVNYAFTPPLLQNNYAAYTSDRINQIFYEYQILYPFKESGLFCVSDQVRNRLARSPSLFQLENSFIRNPTINLIFNNGYLNCYQNSTNK